MTEDANANAFLPWRGTERTGACKLAFRGNADGRSARRAPRRAAILVTDWSKRAAQLALSWSAVRTPTRVQVSASVQWCAEQHTTIASRPPREICARKSPYINRRGWRGAMRRGLFLLPYAVGRSNEKLVCSCHVSNAPLVPLPACTIFHYYCISRISRWFSLFFHTY